jgi:DNA-binding beta-propeller fold protein YncE
MGAACAVESVMVGASVILLFALGGAEAGPTLTVTSVALPGSKGVVALDYLAADRAAARVWIPAANLGSVDVLDLATRGVTRIDGFATGPSNLPAKDRWLGPSAAGVGDGFVFIGNRATAELCSLDARRQVKVACLAAPSAIDGVAYVGATKQVWATAPAAHALVLAGVESGGALRLAGSVHLPGSPEGYAVDDAHGRFFTNLEDANRTVAVDVKSRKLLASWPVPCGRGGPRGLAYDGARQLLFVACTDRVVSLAAAEGGRVLATLPTGQGVDNIDYLDASQTLYVAAGKAARLTLVGVDDGGKLHVRATARTALGARVVVAAADGTAVVGDPGHGVVLLVSPPP